MKSNSQKLLVWLYSPDSEQLRLTNYEELAYLLPDMTQGGRRSLVHYLTQKLLIRTERVESQTKISLTPHGVDAALAQFPAFDSQWQDWQGEWSVIIFKQGPKGDPNFRYLRQFLLNRHTFSLSRGVYLYPGQLPQEILDLFKRMYVGSVVVMGAKKWIFGDERTTVNQQYLLSELSEVYSGISKEINQLLELKNNQKRLTKKSRLQIYSAFDRFFNILKNDPGFLHYYYPDVLGAEEILNQFQQLISSS